MESAMVLKNAKISQKWRPTLLPLFNFFLRLEMSTINPFQITESPPPWIFGPFYGSAVPTRLCLLVLVWKRQWSAISIQGLGNKNVWTLKYTNAMILELKNSPPSPICKIACHKTNVERLRDICTIFSDSKQNGYKPRKLHIIWNKCRLIKSKANASLY